MTLIRQLCPGCHYGVSSAVDGSVHDRNVALGCCDNRFFHGRMMSVMRQWLLFLCPFHCVFLFSFFPSIHLFFYCFVLLVHLCLRHTVFALLYTCLSLPLSHFIHFVRLSSYFESFLPRSFIHLISVSATATSTGDALRLLSVR